MIFNVDESILRDFQLYCRYISPKKMILIRHLKHHVVLGVYVGDDKLHHRIKRQEKIKDLLNISNSSGRCLILYYITKKTFSNEHNDMLMKISCIYLIWLIMISGLGIALLVFGSMHVNDCPGKSFMPIYLILTGVFLLIVFILHLIKV